MSFTRTAREEVFYKWLEELPTRLLYGLEEEFLEATAGPWSFDELGQVLLPEELNGRAVDALPPHVEHWWQLWVENAGARENRRQWVAEMERRYPQDRRTPENGYGWWFSTQEEYRRLAEKYRGFEDEWRDFYERWEDKTTTGMPMSCPCQMNCAASFCVSALRGQSPLRWGLTTAYPYVSLPWCVALVAQFKATHYIGPATT